MRIFKNTWFSRFAGKEGITDGELQAIVGLLESGKVGADLGGGVYKVRLARRGGGKSGGYRVIVFFRSEELTFYHYAYPKANRDNINTRELRVFKELAKRFLAMTDTQLTEAVRTRDFVEICEADYEYGYECE
ncbi:MAG: type II toxin-antitoxin system RelE/ParE family toxin [Treponema sp.]|nr:type II toxin-antitoxin system RelE/ParE family toxin [Treponema sp.]